MARTGVYQATIFKSYVLALKMHGIAPELNECIPTGREGFQSHHITHSVIKPLQLSKPQLPLPSMLVTTAWVVNDKQR